jgi:hypothetical protein
MGTAVRAARCPTVMVAPSPQWWVAEQLAPAPCSYWLLVRHVLLTYCRAVTPNEGDYKCWAKYRILLLHRLYYEQGTIE